jgi:hypothetical protein
MPSTEERELKMLNIDGKVIRVSLKKGEHLLYKLTTQENTTQNDTRWGVGITNFAANLNTHDYKLCTGDVIHAYEHPLIALIRNCQDANIENPKLWLAKGIVGVNNGMKVGCKSLTIIDQLQIPEISLEQKIAFSIYIALAMCKDANFKIWAFNWLSNRDRSDAAAHDASYDASHAASDAAYVASHAAHAAAHDASYDTSRAASDAAYAAAYASYDASHAASDATSDAAYVAAYAAYVASHAASDAAYVAARAASDASYVASFASHAASDAARRSDQKINFVSMAKKAMRIK